MKYTIHCNFGAILEDGEVKTATMEFKDCHKPFTKESYERLSQITALQIEQLTGKKVVKIAPLSDGDMEEADNVQDCHIYYNAPKYIALLTVYGTWLAARIESYQQRAMEVEKGLSGLSIHDKTMVLGALENAHQGNLERLEWIRRAIGIFSGKDKEMKFGDIKENLRFLADLVEGNNKNIFHDMMAEN